MKYEIVGLLPVKLNVAWNCNILLSKGVDKILYICLTLFINKNVNYVVQYI